MCTIVVDAGRKDRSTDLDDARHRTPVRGRARRKDRSDRSVASTRDCSRALRDLAKRLADVDDDVRRKHAVDRTISCRVTDLETDFSGRISDGELVDVKQEALPDAQIKLSVTSDDLVALTDGHLNVASAWATGRLRVDASIKDMLRLRALL